MLCDREPASQRWREPAAQVQAEVLLRQWRSLRVCVFQQHALGQGEADEQGPTSSVWSSCCSCWESRLSACSLDSTASTWAISWGLAGIPVPLPLPARARARLSDHALLAAGGSCRCQLPCLLCTAANRRACLRIG